MFEEDEYRKIYVSKRKNIQNSELKDDTSVVKDVVEPVIVKDAASNEIIEEVIEEEIHSETNDSSTTPLTGEVEGDTIFFKTKEVAKELELSEQEVRNYCHYFSQFLHIEKTVSGHRRFTRRDIDELAAILEIKRNNEFSVEQTIKALSTDEGRILVAPSETEKLRKLMEWMLGKMDEIIKSEVEGIVNDQLNQQTERLIEATSSNMTLIEEKNGESAEKVNETVEELHKQLAASKSENEDIRRQNQEIKEQNEKILNVLNQIVEDQKKKDEKIDELTEQNSKMIDEVSKKKKGLFRWK